VPAVKEIKKMSVIAKDRKETKFQCQIEAERITRALISDVLEKFGSSAHYEEWDPENDMYVVTDRVYPDYAISFMRNRLMEMSAKMLDAIVMANSVNPTTTEGPVRESEISERRIMQDKSIEYLNALKEQCNFIVSLFPLQMYRFKHYTADLNLLSERLRKWKRYIPKNQDKQNDIEK
jgi:hypothetical protein